MAAQNPQQEEHFLQRWLRRRHPKLYADGSVTLLPKRAECFGGSLLLALPADFRVDAQKQDSICFAGAETGLTLSVMRIPFRRNLRSISALDLHVAFADFPLPQRLPEVTRGFLHHAPTLTAEWYGREKTVLHLIQTQQTVFLLLFRHLTAETAPCADAVIYAASLAAHQ